MNSEILAKLREALTSLYPEQASMHRIMDESGIDRSRIDFNSAPINVWHSILKEAEYTERVTDLLEAVQDEYGSNSDFQKARNAYNQSVSRTNLYVAGGSLRRNMVGELAISRNEFWNFSPNAYYIGALLGDKIQVWDSLNGKLHRSIKYDSNYNIFVWSPTSQAIALRDHRNKIGFYSIKTGTFSETYPSFSKGSQRTKNLKSSHVHGDSVTSSIAGNIIVAGDISTYYFSNPRVKNKPSLQFLNLNWSKNQNKIASTERRGITLFDIKSGEISSSLEGHSNSINCLIWSPSGTMLASSSDDSTIKIWDAQSGALYRTLTGHSLWVTDLAWSSVEKFLISCGGDDTIRVWDVQSGWQLNTLEGHTDTVIRVAYSPDGRLIFSQSLDNTLRIWRTDTWETVASIELPDSSKTVFGFDSSSISLASSTLNPNDTIRVMRNQQGFEIQQKSVVLEQTDDYLPSVTIWRLELRELQNNLPKSYRVNYANAKVSSNPSTASE